MRLRNRQEQDEEKQEKEKTHKQNLRVLHASNLGLGPWFLVEKFPTINFNTAHTKEPNQAL